VLETLKRIGYAGFCAVEPFDYVPDGPTSAARAIGYLRALEETIA
jgi:sugar phosphate isomerase/epimerase